MEIGDKVIVRVNGGMVSVLDGRSGIIVEERIPNSHFAMLSGIARWVVKFDEPVVIRGMQLSTCEFREDELEVMMTYEIIAYDKDADYEVSLHKTTDYSDALAHAKKFGEQCRLDLLLNPANGQPLDWVKLVNADDWDVIYWASYNR